MSRRTGALLDYAGAVGRMDIGAVVRLSPRRFVVQEKRDGMYCHLTTDQHGRVVNVLSRTGAVLSRRHVGHLLGQRVSAPDSVIAGEFMAHTERGRLEAERLGYAPVHVFDMVRCQGRYLGRMTYRERRDLLRQAETWAIDTSAPLPYRVEGARARSASSGRFCRAVPTDWRLCPVVDQTAPGSANWLWEAALEGKSEGLVVVALDAGIGKRNAKRKVKTTDSVDAICLSMDETGATLRVRGSEQLVCIGPRQPVPVEVGGVYEVGFEGRYSGGSLRFARLVRHRPDLEGARA